MRWNTGCFISSKSIPLLNFFYFGYTPFKNQEPLSYASADKPVALNCNVLSKHFLKKYLRLNYRYVRNFRSPDLLIFRSFKINSRLTLTFQVSEAYRFSILQFIDLRFVLLLYKDYPFESLTVSILCCN